MLDQFLFVVAMWLLTAIAAFIASRVWRVPVDIGTVVLAMAFWTLYFLILTGGRMLQDPLLPDLRWNWLGKILAIAATVIVIVKSPQASWRDAGVTLRQARGSVLPVLAVIAVMAIAAGILRYALGGSPDRSAETLAYQFLMPSIDEELFYRGLLFALLASAFSQPLSAGSNAITPHLALTALIFGVGHALSFTGGAPGFDVISFCYTGVIGLVLAWARQRTGSILLPMFGHTLVNVGVRLI